MNPKYVNHVTPVHAERMLYVENVMALVHAFVCQNITAILT